jgi:acyl carrier protein phosphodiesterase
MNKMHFIFPDSSDQRFSTLLVDLMFDIILLNKQNNYLNEKFQFFDVVVDLLFF